MRGKMIIYKNFETPPSVAFKLVISTLFCAIFPLQVFAAGIILDPTFSGDGKVTTDFGITVDVTYDMAIQSNGKIVVVGGNREEGVYAAARYNTDGTLDTTFGGDGKVTTDLGVSGVAVAVAIQPDGKIVVVGLSTTDNSLDTRVVVRYNPNGSLDTTFGGGTGIFRFTANAGAPKAPVYDVAIQSDGKIVVVGADAGSGFELARDWVIFRFNPNGTYDTSFGGNGRLVTDFGGTANEAAHTVSILPDGKILVAGRKGYISNADERLQDFALVRYNANGTLDNTFGGIDGRVITDFSGGADGVNGMAIQPDGKIVVSGFTTTINDVNFAVARYTANGFLDTTFSGDGKAQINIDSGGVDIANDVVVQADGKIVLAGENEDTDFVLARFNPNGTSDPEFGQGGTLSTNFTTNSSGVNSEDSAHAIAIQSDGKLVVAGRVSSAFVLSTPDFGVARYSTNSISPFDLDGDNITDISIFRPNGASSQWWWLKSSGGNAAVQFGASTDTIVPADYTGDGKTDIAFWRPSTGQWFVLRSEDFSFFAAPFGANGDVPVPGDYDADGKADFAVFRPTTLNWFINKSSGGTDIFTFGAAGDNPVPGDFDGDGKVDLAVFRPNGGTGTEWWVRRSSNGSSFALQFGTPTDKAVPGDYTGDGKADIAFWRPSNGNWFVLRSEDLSFFAFPFGANGDTAVPGDYDGDGRWDAGVFRPSSNTWFVQRTTAGTLIQQFGLTGDIPLPSSYVR